MLGRIPVKHTIRTTVYADLSIDNMTLCMELLALAWRNVLPVAAYNQKDQVPNEEETEHLQHEAHIPPREKPPKWEPLQMHP